MMQLERQKAKLTSVNSRKEIHGDEHVFAADLKFTFDTSNDILGEFDDGLKTALYRKADGDEPKPQLQLGEGEGWLPKLRFPHLAPIDWDAEIVGGTLQVFYSIDASIDLEIKVTDSFKFALKDGGTVTVSFRVQVKPTQEQHGHLCFLIQENVELSMWPPKPAAQQELAASETVAA